MDDFDTLAGIDRAEFNGDLLGRKQLERFVSAGWVLVALADGIIVGFCVVRPWPERSMAVLDAITISGAVRGRGYGKALLVAAESEASSIGAHSLQLHARSDHSAILAFYRKNGFRRLWRLRRGPENYLDGVAAIRMRKRLRSRMAGIIQLFSRKA
jgi:ribosomal protein S18 acetylase RimI-like enzyme